ncbi:reverse transcriptase domain-containing protein [Tanacetum coccineum]
MSAMANTTLIVTTVTKPATKAKRGGYHTQEQTPGIVPTVEVALTGRTLLTEIILKAETAPVVSKNYMLIPAPPLGQGPNMNIARMTETAPVRRKRGGKVNHRHPAYQRATPEMGDTGSQGDPEDHVKNFQAAAQVECWAMPTLCHMFNSTLIGAARVWFDELPPESIDGYKDLKAAFLAYFMQQKKYVKDPVKIYNIKKRDEETIEEFMERFKLETERMKKDHGRNDDHYHCLHTGRSRYCWQEKSSGTEGPLVIEAEIGKHTIYRMEIPKEAGVCPENFKVALHPNFPDQEVAIGVMLSVKAWTELCSLLKENFDIFAWQQSDMTGVPRSIAKHRLNIQEGYSPVRQKKRGQALERAKAIQTEVQKLIVAGIMREVYYHEWLSNPVMVKKHDGSRQMCVDFTDLNKACLQDCYPLPEIDSKVKSLCGYPFKCFLDAYKGYHQIQMAESDEEKMAFHTSQGVYCYTKTPFGLKSAGATYQRLVDKAFDSQVGRNIEVYVDDLVIKSHTEAEMLRDIDGPMAIVQVGN